jgi:hypothetical protein
MPETRTHARHCEGHIDCPVCGPDACARPVVWREPGVPAVVVCVTCWTRFDVSEDDDDSDDREDTP